MLVARNAVKPSAGRRQKFPQRIGLRVAAEQLFRQIFPAEHNAFFIRHGHENARGRPGKLRKIGGQHFRRHVFQRVHADGDVETLAVQPHFFGRVAFPKREMGIAAPFRLRKFKSAFPIGV